MEWVKSKPTYGSHIRVNRGLYSHHGIYLNDENVIHFASLVPGHETDPEMAEVSLSDLKTFLKDGEVEVAKYNEEELKNARSPQDVVNYAFSKLGTKGYNLVSNNCEHFANECIFGYKKSNQVDKVMKALGSFFKL